MKVREIMKTELETVRPTDTLQCAAARMKANNIGALPVEEDDRPVGIITDRDITIRATAKGCDPNITLVSEAMTSVVVYCFRDQPIAEAAGLMEWYAVRRLLVLDGEKRLVGIVSLDDLANVPGEQQQVGKVLEHVSPAAPERWVPTP